MTSSRKLGFLFHPNDLEANSNSVAIWLIKGTAEAMHAIAHDFTACQVINFTIINLSTQLIKRRTMNSELQ